jgi:hypothetical protein
MLKLVTAIASATMLALPSIATAAVGIIPPNASFTLVGGGNLVRNGNNGWVCQWTLNMQTGASIGGTPPRAAGGNLVNGTATGTCSVMTVDPSTFSILNADANGGTGFFNGLTFRQSGTPFCSTSSQVPFNYVNNGGAPSSVQFPNLTAIGAGCTYTADLKTGADLNVAP